MVEVVTVEVVTDKAPRLSPPTGASGRATWERTPRAAARDRRGHKVKQKNACAFVTPKASVPCARRDASVAAGPTSAVRATGVHALGHSVCLNSLSVSPKLHSNRKSIKTTLECHRLRRGCCWKGCLRPARRTLRPPPRARASLLAPTLESAPCGTSRKFTQCQRR